MTESSATLVSLDHLREFITVSKAVDRDSGSEGRHYHPYEANEPYDLEKAFNTAQADWAKPLVTPGWRRGFASYAKDQMVGILALDGSPLGTGLHRVRMGMGIMPEYRGQGRGTALMTVAIEWCRAQPQIAWVDLGVFADNPPAQNLYKKFGFSTIGRRDDQFRIDGATIDNIEMTLCVGNC